VKSRILFLIFCASIFGACNKDVVFEKNVSIPDYKWDLNNLVALDAEISDTTVPYNIYINVRNASGYQYSNLFLFMTTGLPDGSSARDTLELTLADESGRWLGEGMGDLRDNRLLFKKKFFFPEQGTYRFSLQQAMRVNPLPEIADVGLRIEKSK
jgi:gliding motility-associated lipoprotein GldH